MKEVLDDFLDFIFKTRGGTMVLVVIAILVVMFLFTSNQPEPEPLPWVGIQCKNMTDAIIKKYKTPFRRGVLVTKVFANSPADQSNIASGDFIIKFKNRPINNMSELKNAIFDLEPREKARLTVYREGAYYSVLFKVGERPLGESLPADTVALTGTQKTNAAAPPITSNAVLPHAYRGVCSNCHQIVSKNNMPNVQVAAVQNWNPQGQNQVPGQNWTRQNQVPIQRQNRNLRRQNQVPGQNWNQQNQVPVQRQNLNQPRPPQIRNQMNLPGATTNIPITEFTWNGIALESFNAANAAGMGLPTNATGVMVDEVKRLSPGARAGILPGDLISEINGYAIYDVNSFAETVNIRKLNGGVLLVNRKGRSMYITIPEF